MAQTSDSIYAQAVNELQLGNTNSALLKLENSLHDRPRAAQTLYLFGVANIISGNTVYGYKCINKAYDIKPWIRDDISGLPNWLTLLTKSSSPNETWIKYQQLRYKFSIVGSAYEILIDSLVSRQDSVSFIEIGANDGKSGDPLYPYILSGQLKGTLIEPQPTVFKKLIDNYKSTSGNTFLNIGISDVAGELTLYASTKSTLTSSSPHKNSLRSTAGLTKQIVPTQTLKTVLKKHKKTPDILQIDTEGHEFEILKNFPFEKHPFKLIHIEFYCLSLNERIAIFEKLYDAGYIWNFDGMNLTALRHKDFPNMLWNERLT